MLFWRLLRFIIPIAAAAGWAWFIYWISVDSSPTGAGVADDGGFLAWLPRADLFAHFALYAILAFLMRWSLGWLHTWRVFEQTIKNAMPIVIAGVYGIALELQQAWAIETRVGDPTDAIANILGALAMIGFLAYALPRTTRRTRNLIARLG
jgi:hypothetical protein